MKYRLIELKEHPSFKLYLKENDEKLINEVNVFLKEIVDTGISFALFGDNAYYAYFSKENDDFNETEKEALMAIDELFSNPLDFSVKPTGTDAAICYMNQNNIWQYAPKEEVVYENDDIPFGYSMILRERLIENISRKEILGFIIS